MKITRITDITKITERFKGGGNLPPFKADAEMLIDGTIIEDSGDYYFKDVSGNGHDLLITGYDWADRGIKGFPYKTAATISAPVGDTALIAEDFNNYFYDSLGAPNEIPVVSLFQDVDYEHKLFTKHSGQVLDLITGVELQEPYVKNIVLYKTVKTGADLVKCQVYYVVPEEDLTAVWADSSVAVTGVGTKASPYKTFREAYLAAYTTEKKIYLTTGEYIRDGNLAQYIDAEGVGYSAFKDTVSPVILTSAANQTFKGIIVDGSNTASFGVQTGSDGTTFDRVCIKNTTSYAYYNGFGSTGSTIKNSSFGWSYLRSGGTIDTCYFNEDKTTIVGNADATKRELTIKNSFIDVNLTAQSSTTRHIFELRGNIDISIYGNLAHTEVIRGWFRYATTVASLDNQLTFKYNTCVDDLNDNNLHYLSVVDNVYREFTTIDIHDNNITLEDDVLYSAINVDGGDTVNVYNNIITSKSLVAGGGVRVVNVDTALNIYNNKIDSYEGSPITIGSEVTQYVFDLNIYDNYLTGPREHDNFTSSAHLLFVKRVPDAKIFRNYIKGGNLGIVYKGMGDDNTDAFISYNTVVNCGGNLLAKGQRDVLFYGNTVVNDGAYPNTLNWYGGQVLNSDGGVTEDASGCIFKNNIIYDIAEYTGGAAGFTFIISDAESETNTEMDYNVVYSANGVYMDYKGVDKTFLEGQGLGYEENGLNQDPELTNFIPSPSSPAYGNGENLGNDYRAGLDATTDWGSDTEVPNVVTRLQGDNWDIGAYVNSDTEYTYVIDENGDFVTDSEGNKTII